MGVNSIDDVYDNVKDEDFRSLLAECKEEHQKLGSETHSLLNSFCDEGKEPSLMAKNMAHIKTNVKMAMDNSDNTIADLITDGCNMGVKYLNRYLDQYKAAAEKAKDIAKRLINLEEKLAVDIRGYL